MRGTDLDASDRLRARVATGMAAILLGAIAIGTAVGSAPQLAAPVIRSSWYPLRFWLPDPNGSRTSALPRDGARQGSALSTVEPAEVSTGDPAVRDGAFAAAFAATAASGGSPLQSRTSGPVSRRGVLVLDYDLAGRTDSAADGDLVARKMLSVNGAAAGTITIRLGKGSMIYIDRDAIAGALGRDAEAMGADSFVSIDALRDRGLQVRYDAMRDAIEIAS